MKHTPMNLFSGEHTMAVNKIAEMRNIFGWTWYPTYYFKMDAHPKEEPWEQIAPMLGAKLFLWDGWKGKYPIDAEWIPKCKHHGYMYDNIKAVESWHLPTICTAFGSMSAMIQLGVLMGYEEIYLLGCDMNYTDGESHAFDGYLPDTFNGKGDLDNGNNLALHKMAKRCSPIPIYNATIGGGLEVYPRVDYIKILKGI